METSDTFRNLGYSSHLVDDGPFIYQTTPADFAPEFWTQFWPDQPYIYPPAAMLFFSFFSATGLGLFFVKAVLTAADLGTALLIIRLLGGPFAPLAGLLAFSAPVGVWYVSHEGQLESLLGFFICAAIFFTRKKRWFWAGALWCVGLQVKQFAVLAAPFFLIELMEQEASTRLRAGREFVMGGLAALAPVLPFYFVAPGIWFRPFQIQGLVYNPFHWRIWDPARFGWNPQWLVRWNAFFSLASLSCLGGYLAWRPSFAKLCRVTPALAFWTLLKSLNWAQFWYIVPVPALTMTIKGATRIIYVLLLLYWLQCGRSFSVLLDSDNIGGEHPSTVARFHACQWHCNYRQKD